MNSSRARTTSAGGNARHTGTPLAYMAYGNREAFAVILKRCGITNQLNSNGACALHVAAGANDTTLSRQLIQHGGYVNIRTEFGETPLDIAKRHESQEAAACLRATGGAENKRVGERVTLSIDSAVRLLRHSSGAFFVTYLVLAKQEKKVVDELQRAVGAHLFGYVEHLLSTGVPTSLAGTDGQTALHHVARHGYLDICQLLLSRATPLGANYQDRQGNTPMHIAAIYGRTQILQALIDWGADSGATNTEGFQARDLAFLMGHSEASVLCQNALIRRETAV